jgi:hypothetical protein
MGFKGLLVHQSFRFTLTMRSNLTDYIWSWQEFLEIKERNTKVA